MIITTAGRATNKLVERANTLAISFGLTYMERNGHSIEALKERYQTDIVIVGQNRLEIAPLDDSTQLFFHPSLAMVRAKRLFKGEQDSLITAAKLTEGMSLFDCTLGLGSDSIIASIAVGSNGAVTGVEGNTLLHLITKEGLTTYSSGIAALDQAMRRINVAWCDHYSFLLQAETDAVDVVYFDPMFRTGVATSNGINTIRAQAVTTDLTSDVIAEAKRVAKQRVVLKDHWQSERFEQLGFSQQKRKSSLFHYGTIELE